MPPLPKINLADLFGAGGMPGLTVAFGQMYAEAAAVCLAHCGHVSGVGLSTRGVIERHYEVHWSAITEQINSSHYDIQEATESGASAIALFLARDLLELNALERSKKESGFDYWVGPDGAQMRHGPDGPEMLEGDGVYRLEITGTTVGTDSLVRSKLKQKKDQVNKYRKKHPGIGAYVCVVVFNYPESHLEKV